MTINYGFFRKRPYFEKVVLAVFNLKREAIRLPEALPIRSKLPSLPSLPLLLSSSFSFAGEMKTQLYAKIGVGLGDRLLKSKTMYFVTEGCSDRFSTFERTEPREIQLQYSRLPIRTPTRLVNNEKLCEI